MSVLLLLAACGSQPDGSGAPGESDDAGAFAAPADAGAQTGGGAAGSPDAGSPGAGTPGADAGVTAGPDGGAGSPDAGATAPPKFGCGSGGGGATGGAADLFPCDSPWYQDVSAAAVSAESASIISVLQSRGGWGLSNHFQIDFSFALLHGDASTSRQVWVQPKDASDGSPYYQNESDLLSGNRGWSVPTPPGGHLEGESGYSCPQIVVAGKNVNANDCHLMVVDDARHLLIELYGANYDSGSGRWYATQESVWNLNHSYGKNERGLGCTSADAAGLPLSPGIIGLRETAGAAREPGGYLLHALRFILPNDRTRRAFVAPASHAQGEAQLTSSGPPYGVRFRLRADFDESRLRSAGAKIVARTLKRYGMFLADGGQTALTADDEAYVRKSDPTLTWSGLLGPLDLDGIQATDFQVVGYDASTFNTSTSCAGVDKTPLALVTPQGRGTGKRRTAWDGQRKPEAPDGGAPRPDRRSRRMRRPGA